jgi:hypothetical protein
MTLLELADARTRCCGGSRWKRPARTTTACRSRRSPRQPPSRSAPIRCSVRVASYYHDVGKINKADYFVENQTDGRTATSILRPSVSLLIIIGT